MEVILMTLIEICLDLDAFLVTTPLTFALSHDCSPKLLAACGSVFHFVGSRIDSQGSHTHFALTLYSNERL